MKKILVVDDNAGARKAISAILLGAGVYEVIEVNTGEMAIEAANANKPDLILMDINVPGKIGGLEAARIFTSDPDTSNIKILMLSANRQDLEIRICKKAGADDFMFKPLKPMSLLSKIQELIG